MAHLKGVKLLYKAITWYIGLLHVEKSGPSGRTVEAVGLRPLACWDYGFESHRGTDVCRECCVLSGGGLCDELITRPEGSYRLWCVVVYDLETSWMRRPWPTDGCCAKYKQISKQKNCWNFVCWNYSNWIGKNGIESVGKKSNRLTPGWQNTRGFNAVTKKLVQSVERFHFEHSFTRRAQRDGSMLPLLEEFSEN